MRADNVLRDIPWIKTNLGLLTVEEALKRSREVHLEVEVPGYEYGAQFRFLMTIFPLLLEEAGSHQTIRNEQIDAVLDRLEPAVHLFDENDPFLQLPLRLATDPDALRSVSSQVQKDPKKILPAEPGEEQTRFWNFEKSLTSDHGVDQSAAVLLLVCSYFYKSGGNSALDGRSPKNGVAGLRYVDAAKTPPAVEIIPLGSNLFETLAMATPRDFRGPLPHWADREGKSLGVNDRLWLSSWSTNAIFCVWEDTDGEAPILRSVGSGGVPSAWSPRQYFNPDQKDQWKEITSTRDVEDPLYFYVEDPRSETKKLRYMNLGSEPFYFIARWNAERCSTLLSTKWSKNVDYDEERLENILFIEHATGGTAQSFTIRHSRVIVGWKDELLPDPSRVDALAGIYEDILMVRSKLTGLFTEKGTLKHLVAGGRSSVQKNVEMAFWNEMAETVHLLSHGELPKGEVKKIAKLAALRALNYGSSNRDTVHIEEHLKAERILRGIK